MRVTAVLSTNVVWRERVLAVVAVSLVAALLSRIIPHVSLTNNFTLFPIMMGVGAWLPAFSRRRFSTVGDLSIGGCKLIIRGRFRTRRIELAKIRGARAVEGRRGASVLLSLSDGATMGFGLDRAVDALQLAKRIQMAAGAADVVEVRALRWTRVVQLLRPAVTAFSVAYYLHVVMGVIPGEKAVYGLGGVFLGLVLLALHLFRQRPAQDISAHVDRRFHEHPRALRAHLRAHSTQPQLSALAEAPSRLAEEDEALSAWLTRMREDLAGDGPYRGDAGALRAKLDEAIATTSLPIAERALALRILSTDQPEVIGKRIATFRHDSDDEIAWIEAVARAESDQKALRQVARRKPAFDAK